MSNGGGSVFSHISHMPFVKLEPAWAVSAEELEEGGLGSGLWVECGEGGEFFAKDIANGGVAAYVPAEVETATGENGGKAALPFGAAGFHVLKGKEVGDVCCHLLAFISFRKLQQTARSALISRSKHFPQTYFLPLCIQPIVTPQAHFILGCIWFPLFLPDFYVEAALPFGEDGEIEEGYFLFAQWDAFVCFDGVGEFRCASVNWYTIMASTNLSQTTDAITVAIFSSN